MITRLILLYCLLAVWALQASHLGLVHAKDGGPQLQSNLPQCNQTTSQLSITSVNSTGGEIEDVAVDESISASILKLSHHPAPNLMQATPALLTSDHKAHVHKESQRASQQIQAPSSDRGRPTPSQPETTNQLDNGKNKRKGLMSFMGQPRKLSISSLLPLRSSGTKQSAPANNSSSSQTNRGTQQQQQQQQQQLTTNIGSNFLTGALSEEEFNTMLNEPEAFNENSPFLGGNGRPPVLLPTSPHAQDPRPTMAHPLQDFRHHQHMLSPFDHHFDGQLMASMHLLPHFVPPHAHHFAAGTFQQPMSSAGQRATTPQEIFLADQSGEHFHKIKLNKLTSLPPVGGQSLPFILASTSPALDSQAQQQLNRTALLQAAAQQLTAAAAAAALAQQQQQRQAASNQSQSAPAGNASAALTSNALLSDRARNLISQLNLAAAAAASVTNSSKSSVRNNRETTTEQPLAVSAAANGTATNNGLANMIRNAAEAWATTNSMQSALPSQTSAAASSGSLSADASPTIIVEHDGPTVTTLDYGGLQRPGMIANQAPPGDDDDVTNNFYTETEEAEQEEGGSHEARRIVQPRPGQHGRHSHFRHAPHHHHTHNHNLRHPDFGDGTAAPPGGGGYTMGQLGPGPVPSANEFFNEQLMSDPRGMAPRGPPNRLLVNQGGGYGQPAGPDYYQARPRQAPVAVQSTKDRYPDSINAIKEQEERHGGSRVKQSSGGGGSSASDGDPVEQLIKELHELHKRRKLSSSSSSTGGGPRDSEEQDRGSTRGSPRGASSDEFEDILSMSGGQQQQQDKGDQDGQQDEGSSGDAEDEQMRLLRNKLLDRLRAKHDRKKGTISSSFSGDSIRIPLHALLLAALDRRMSPSESKSVSTSAEGSPSVAGSLLDERNRELILSGRQDFNEATADLGSLLDSNNLFEQIIQSANHGGQQSPTQSQQLTAGSADELLRLPLNLQNVSQESLTPAGMLLIENMAALDEANQQQKRFNLSDTSGGAGDGNLQFVPAATTRMPATPFSSSTTATPTSTTATPTPGSTSTGAPRELRDSAEPLDLQRHRGGGGRGLQKSQRSFKNHRDASSGAQKGRRALRDEGDFDVDRHVDEYASDKNDGSLEPSWMKPSPARGNRRVGGRPRDGTVEFEDEFDEIDRQTRRKMQQQQQQRKRRRGARGKHGGNKSDDEANYEANEQRFFNKMQRDTDANIGDVDQTIRSIERSIPDEEAQPARRGSGRQRGRADDANEDPDASEPTDAGDEDGGDDGGGESPPRDDEGGETGESRRSRSHRGWRSPDAAESQQSAATLRASMIDDEISRMEQEGEAKQKRHKTGAERRREASGDPDENPDQQDDSGNESSESQIEPTRQAIGDSPPADKPAIKIVVEGDSNVELAHPHNS